MNSENPIRPIHTRSEVQMMAEDSMVENEGLPANSMVVENMYSMVQVEEQWQDWWGRKNKQNERLFMAIHRGDLTRVKELLNQK